MRAHGQAPSLRVRFPIWFRVRPADTLPPVPHSLTACVSDWYAGFGRLGHFLADMARGLQDVHTWTEQTVAQLRRIGVNSVPIALFVAAFTGVVLALQASYTFTGAVQLYFVGTLVGKTIMLELGPVLTGLVLAGRVGANTAAELGLLISDRRGLAEPLCRGEKGEPCP